MSLVFQLKPHDININNKIHTGIIRSLKPESTMIYTHVASKDLMEIESPLD
jgi:hypothetical protein